MSLGRFSSIWLVISIIILATTLGSVQLTRDALWYDELATYYFVGAAQFEPLLPLGRMLDRILLTDRWPPLFYFMLIGWSELTGWNAYTGRVLSLFFGVLLIACTYRLAVTSAPHPNEKLNRWSVGVISALSLSVSAFFVYYLHELRTYTLYPLLVMGSAMLYWELTQRVTRIKALAFVLALVAALYSHPTTYPMIFVLGIYHLIFARKQETWGRILFLFVIAAVLTLPWLLTIYYKLQQGMSIGLTTPWLPLTAFLPSFGNNVPFLLIAALLYAAWFIRGRGVGFITFMLVGSVGVIAALNVLSPFLFHMRHMIGVIPFLLILCAFATAHAYQRSPYLVGAFIGVWVIAGIWNSFDFRYMLATPGHEPTIPMAAMDTLVDAAEQCITADDAVILHIGEPFVRGLEWEWINDVVMVYYWRDVPFRFAQIGTLNPITNYDPMGRDPQVQVLDMTQYQPKAARYIDGAERVWWFQLNGLPEIEHTTLLEETLREEGYTNSTRAIETDRLTGWVYSPQEITNDPCPIESS